MIWKQATHNTKSLEITAQVRERMCGQRAWVAVCKNCGDIQPFTLTDNRQLLGNCYQTICICNTCNSPFIIDNYLYNLTQYYLSLKSKQNT